MEVQELKRIFMNFAVFGASDLLNKSTELPSVSSTYGVCVEFVNCRQIGVAYASATTSALVTALSFKSFMSTVSYLNS